MGQGTYRPHRSACGGTFGVYSISADSTSRISITRVITSWTRLTKWVGQHPRSMTIRQQSGMGTSDGGQATSKGRLNPANPRHFTASGREVDFSVYVVCTDRGQHTRTMLSTARRELDGIHGMNHALECFAPPDPDAKPHTATGHDAYTFWCPRCGRTPHIRSDRWWQAIDDLGRLGVDELDISLLPF